jgi:hypothetical protein
VRRRPEPDDLGSERDWTVVAVAGDVLETDETDISTGYSAARKAAQIRCKFQAGLGRYGLSIVAEASEVH